MSLDRRGAETFFKQKLPGSRKVEGARHVAYQIVASNGRVLLGNLTVSRGAPGGELDLRNIKGLAVDMGMSMDGLIEASKCRIRPAIVALCAVTRVLEHAHQLYSLDPVQFDADIIKALQQSIRDWFKLVPPGGKQKLSSRENKELLRTLNRLEAVRHHAVIGALAEDAISASRQKLGVEP